MIFYVVIAAVFVIWAVRALAKAKALPAPPPAPTPHAQAPNGEAEIFARLQETAKKIFREEWGTMGHDMDFVADMEDPAMLEAAKRWVPAEEVSLTYRIMKRMRAAALGDVVTTWIKIVAENGQPLPAKLLPYVNALGVSNDVAVLESMTGDEYYAFKHEILFGVAPKE